MFFLPVKNVFNIGFPQAVENFDRTFQIGLTYEKIKNRQSSNLRDSLKKRRFGFSKRATLQKNKQGAPVEKIS